MHVSHVVPTAAADARIWWSVYCLERILAFETGRPSALRDADCIVPVHLVRDGLKATNSADIRVFEALIGLCQQMSLVLAQVFSRDILCASQAKRMSVIGACDARLVAWADSLPLDFRPNEDSSRAMTGPGTLACVHALYFQVSVGRLIGSSPSDILTAPFPQHDHTAPNESVRECITGIERSARQITQLLRCSTEFKQDDLPRFGSQHPWYLCKYRQEAQRLQTAVMSRLSYRYTRPGSPHVQASWDISSGL